LLKNLAKKLLPKAGNLFGKIPWKKMFDSGRKGLGKAFDKVKDFFKNTFQKNTASQPIPIPATLSDNMTKPNLSDAAGNLALFGDVYLTANQPAYKTPHEIKGVLLNETERARLKDGKSIFVDGMTGDDGQKFSGFAKMNEKKGKLEIFSENPDKPGQVARQSEGRQHVAQKQDKSANKLKIA
jgi:hypothetical protein